MYGLRAASRPLRGLRLKASHTSATVLSAHHSGGSRRWLAPLSGLRLVDSVARGSLRLRRQSYDLSKRPKASDDAVLTQTHGETMTEPSPAAGRPTARHLLTTDDVAKLLGVSRRTVLALGLPEIRLRRRLIRFRRDDVDDLMYPSPESPRLEA